MKHFIHICSAIGILLFYSSLYPYVLNAQTITQNEVVSVSALVGAPPSDPISGGGGGSTTFDYPLVGFSGFAYPNATVVLSKNAVFKTSVSADETGFFSISVPELFESTSLYTLYAEDTEKERSVLLNYPLVTTKGFITQISGIVFAPTITTDAIAVREEDTITISGQSRPNKNSIITIAGQGIEKYYSVISDSAGKYSVQTTLIGFPKGEYTISARYENDRRQSKLLKIIVGDQLILRSQDIVVIPGDCNKDTVIDLRDFSILAYWYLRPNPPTCVDTNSDGIINIIDFSILAYYWTG